MPDIDLYIRGNIYSGWTDATITKSLDAIFGEARLSLTRLIGDAPAHIPAIRLDDTARITIDGETLLTGYVKSRNLEIDATGFDLDVVIQDKSALLFRGSVVGDHLEWTNQTALQIIDAICKPFAITVRAEVPVGKPFEKFTVQPGDTAAKVIERICRHRALMVYADVSGNLVLTTARAATTIADEIRFDAQNGNALSLSLSEDISERHNEYICVTQSPRTEAQNLEHTLVVGHAKDHGLSHYCPLMIIADEPGNAADMSKLATTTAALNAARSETRDYVVAGHRNAEGKLWDINKTVLITDRFTGFSATRLISKCVFSISAGTAPETRLSVSHPDIYTLAREPNLQPGEL